MPESKQLTEQYIDQAYERAAQQYLQLDQDLQEIQKMLSFKAMISLSTVDEANVNRLINEELLRRERLFQERAVKELNILKQLVKQKF